MRCMHNFQNHSALLAFARISHVLNQMPSAVVFCWFWYILFWFTFIYNFIVTYIDYVYYLGVWPAWFTNKTVPTMVSQHVDCAILDGIVTAFGPFVQVSKDHKTKRDKITIA